ncbi:MAG: WecB/TagA/CpsF family glycosyltransferase [Terriglobales bacterium]
MSESYVLPAEAQIESEVRRAYHVLGIRMDAVQIPQVIAKMEAWIAQRDTCRFIAVTNVHVLMEARHEPSFRRVLDSADLCVPDGMPLVWIGRSHGFPLEHRVYGPDLLLDFCRATETKHYRHFFYGGQPGVPEKLAARLKDKFPSLEIAGTYSPPFRALTPQEDTQIIESINQAAPDVLWVGLGCPKQEHWMFQHRDRLRVPVQVGVGQAFDLHAGRLKQAPSWMRNHGFEWLFRLASEPRRLWRRYLLYNSEFVFNELLELLGVTRFD